MSKSLTFKIEKRFLALSENSKAGHAIRHIRKAASEDVIFYAYVVDEKGLLKGVLPLRSLLTAGKNRRLGDIMIRQPISVTAKMKDEEIAGIFTRTKFLALPVVDESGRITGTVTYRKAIDLIKKESAEDVLKIQGADITVFDKSIIRRLKTKLPWLITTVISGLICGWIVFKFEPALKKILALAVFIPLITAMGESVAGQASAIIIEGLILDKIKEKKMADMLLRQMIEGALMALFIAGAVWGLTFVWLKDFPVAHIIGLTIAVTILLATFNGTLGPLVLKKMGIDPVASTNPLVFAVTDITVLIFYFSFALYMIKFIQ